MINVSNTDPGTAVTMSSNVGDCYSLDLSSKATKPYDRT